MQGLGLPAWLVQELRRIQSYALGSAASPLVRRISERKAKFWSSECRGESFSHSAESRFNSNEVQIYLSFSEREDSGLPAWLVQEVRRSQSYALGSAASPLVRRINERRAKEKRCFFILLCQMQGLGLARLLPFSLPARIRVYIKVLRPLEKVPTGRQTHNDFFKWTHYFNSTLSFHGFSFIFNSGLF